MNLPNKLTLLRIVLVPVFMIFAVLPYISDLSPVVFRLLAAASFGAAALTDLFDGKIARKRGLVTDFGKFLDPIADKFLIFAALFTVMCIADEKYRYWLLALTTIVVLRELAVTTIRLVAKGKENRVIAASMIGKAKTMTQCIGFEIILLEPVFLGSIEFFTQNRPLSIIACIAIAFVTVYSGIDYLKKYWQYISADK